MSWTRKMLRKMLPAAAILAVLTGTASAQSPLQPKFSIGADRPPLSPEEQARQDAIDKAYKSATNKIPDRKAPADPWSEVRPAPATPSAKRPPQ
jgi:hypothetical protein